MIKNEREERFAENKIKEKKIRNQFNASLMKKTDDLLV
jgi:hypothetical protein